MIFTCFKDDLEDETFDKLFELIEKHFQSERIDGNCEEISIYSKDDVDIISYVSRIKNILSNFSSIENIDLQINITLNNI